MEKRRRPLLLAFCIPVAVMLAVIVYKEIYPFGDRCFLRVDMYNQYMPFFTEFHRKIREGGSLFFSWNAGLGANFLALYAYYLASPMNWLLFFCPGDHIIEFMTLLIVVKIGLCGLTFAWYLKKHFRTDRYAIAAFAACYALSGFMCAYNWNIMWLDCIFLAPVILWGLEELVYGKRPMLYGISLGASILTNYYISILICIFLVLYYGILALPLPLREKIRSFRQFALFSLLGAGLSGCVLLPGTLALRSTRFDHAAFPERIKFYFHLPEIMARHCLNVPAEIRNDHWPNIYCGAAVFLFLPLYVCCRRIRWKEKLPKLLLLAFFYMSFSLNILEFLWHGLNFPDSLPARQSFLYIFIVLTMSFEAFQYFREYSLRQIALTAVGAAVFLALCGWYIKSGDLTIENFAFTVLYLLVYCVLLFWYRESSRWRKLPVLLLFAAVIMEVSMNTIETSVATTSRSAYCGDYQANAALLECLEQEEGEFRRIEQYSRMTKNDGMLAGFPTATYFSSTVNEEAAHFYKRLGMSTSKVFYSYDGATPLASALLSVGYMVSDSLEDADDFHALSAEADGAYLYRKTYTLPAGFVVAPDLEESWDMEEGSPAQVQNALAEALGIEEPLFSPVEVSCANGEAYIKTAESGYIYAYPEACSTRNITADTEAGEKTYEKVYYPHFLDIGWCNEGSTIKLTQSGDQRNGRNELEVTAYRLNLSTLREMIDILGRAPLRIEEMTDTYMCGIVESGTDGLLVTSIPNEAGWSAAVDGKPVQIKAFGGAMIGMELPAGTHTVTLTYMPPGLRAGLAVSIVSAAILLCQFAVSKAHSTKSGTVSSME